LFRRERALFRSHRSLSGAPEWALGALVEHEGTVYRVTRWRELPPVSLDRGGSVREWEVWGRKASSQEVRDELAGAAQTLLKEEDGKE
jgi:hypothetical protein